MTEESAFRLTTLKERLQIREKRRQGQSIRNLARSFRHGTPLVRTILNHNGCGILSDGDLGRHAGGHEIGMHRRDREAKIRISDSDYDRPTSASTSLDSAENRAPQRSLRIPETGARKRERSLSVPIRSNDAQGSGVRNEHVRQKSVDAEPEILQHSVTPLRRAKANTVQRRRTTIPYNVPSTSRQTFGAADERIDVTGYGDGMTSGHEMLSRSTESSKQHISPAIHFFVMGLNPPVKGLTRVLSEMGIVSVRHLDALTRALQMHDSDHFSSDLNRELKLHNIKLLQSRVILRELKARTISDPSQDDNPHKYKTVGAVEKFLQDLTLPLVHHLDAFEEVGLQDSCYLDDVMRELSGPHSGDLLSTLKNSSTLKEITPVEWLFFVQGFTRRALVTRA